MTGLDESVVTEMRVALNSTIALRTADSRTGVMGAGSDDLESGLAYLAATAPGGWHLPSWPQSLGGRGVDDQTADAIDVIRDEYAVPDLYPWLIGTIMVGPTLLEYGTAEQQQRWMPPIADGSEIWCQMFSEPDAGSDLANVAMRADRDGDEWTLSGQKVWTSRGSYADWAICVARSHPELPKHKGLTMFAVRMDQPGIEVRTLNQMNGDTHFSEIFFDEVKVSDADRIGSEGDGWKLSLTVLAHERSGGVISAGLDLAGLSGPLPGWLADLQAVGQVAGAVARDRAMKVFVLEKVSAMTAARAEAEAERSGTPGPSGSGTKVRNVQVYVARAQAIKDFSGAAGMLSDSPGHVEFLTGPSMSIRGGTAEIQRNIIGERVLGLPGEPRLDRDIAWNEARKGVL
jgi:alkylation response protein AidB-like acyl-CoA dehydrogenase